MTNPTIPVFYHDEQVHDACSYSKSPLKPGLVARRIGPDPAFEFKSSLIHPIASDRLALTHEMRHVQALIAGEKADGFGNKSKKDNRAIRTTVGNYLAAAEWAAAGLSELGVVWSLTSGFHHAGYDTCEGFCTFNALNLAAAEIWKYRGIKSLIVDEDAHFFNGCVDIRERCNQGEYLMLMSSEHTHADNNLTLFELELLQNLEAHNPGLIMYQSGVDNWIADPLGGNLTMEELYLRDLIVFSAAKARGIPVVCNLAGGYADNYEDTLQIHMNTGEAMKCVFLGMPPTPVYPATALALEASI